MRIAILDPAAGISGDMTLGALVDAGLEESWLTGLPARVGFPEVTVVIDRVDRASVSATKVDFAIPQSRVSGHGRTVGDLIELVRGADVSDSVKHTAVRAFGLLGEAEGQVHGVAPNKVHLHEVGAVDAVLDIVGAVEGFERLGVDAVYNLPVALGTGWVEAAHGHLPVPAPATARLLEGMDVTIGAPVEGEATTPTGAVLLRVLSRGSPPSRWRMVASAWGAGTRNPASYPGALRLMLAESAHEAGVVEVVATDMDDMQPEYVEPLRTALLDAGAVDCQAWPTHGKKGRVSIRVEALVPAAAVERVITALFVHGTTGGIRRWPATRATLARSELKVELEGASRVRVKAWKTPTGVRFKAEYDDVVAAAERLGLPALTVAREAEQRAEAMLRDSGTEVGYSIGE
jgi:uncharacterized protein (TIGR00299 family) protein